jgi:hypothetical protein
VRGSILAAENLDDSEPFKETYGFERVGPNKGLDIPKLSRVLAKTVKPCDQSNFPKPFERSDHL